MGDEGIEAGPVVVAANWYAFRPGETIRHERVRSQCYLWVVDGRGEVRSAGASVPLRSGMVLTLPWDHDIEYVADSRSPFRLGTVHVVPRHSHTVPVVPRVAHVPEDPLLEDPARSAGPPPPLRVTSPLVGDTASDASRRIADLGRYVVQRYCESSYDESVFRALGELMVAESEALRCGHTATRGIPAAVDVMTDYVRSHLRSPLRVAEIADVGGCSAATAERLFSRHLGSSVAAWVRSARLREAATLLSTTSLRVGEVARAVGFADQLYFSRVFRATYGVPPSAYASSALRP